MSQGEKSFPRVRNWPGINIEFIFSNGNFKLEIKFQGGKPTKTGQTVLELQQQLPKARIVYASATGASEPKHMAYMVRLGIWGPGSPFKNFQEFLSAVEKR